MLIKRNKKRRMCCLVYNLLHPQHACLKNRTKSSDLLATGKAIRGDLTVRKDSKHQAANSLFPQQYA